MQRVIRYLLAMVLVLGVSLLNFFGDYRYTGAHLGFILHIVHP
ncbi:hypothetical protein [Shewanella sp.]|nr:hypothetical protein [Shewanella sp.]